MKKLTFLLLSTCLLLKLSAQPITSSDLPIFVINTNGGTIVDEPKITADMGIIYNGPGVRNNYTDPFNHYNGKVGIEYRGQSTQSFPMKAYGFELRDAAGSSINRSLFGLPSESDWILYAPYNEKTLMHNVLAYDMARAMGHWSSHTKYVEVVVNGQYMGIFVFMEKIKQGSGRVNISKLKAADITGDALTGGYIVSIDKEADGWFSQYPFLPGAPPRLQYTYVYPKITNIVQVQKDYIKSYVDSFETAMFSANYQDTTNGWRRFADERSFIDYFIENEVSRNVDGYRLSTYMYKDRASKGGKLFMGPVWDYDLSFRNADYCDGSEITGWAYRFNNICPGDYWQIPFWWDKLFADPLFLSRLHCRWKELRETTLSLTRLNAFIDSAAFVTTEARQRHFLKWPVLGQYIWPNPSPIATTYEGEVTTLKNWLAARIAWLDANIPNTGDCYDYPADVKESVIIGLYPNPFGGIQTIKVTSRIAQDISLKVTNSAGQQMSTVKYTLGIGQNTITVPSGAWAAGLYYYEFRTASGEKFSRKGLKQ